MFPKLRDLGMQINCHDKSTFGISFPHLEHVTLYIKDFYGRNRDFTIENAKDLLRANRQLNNVEFHFPCQPQLTSTTILDMISGNSFISNMYFHGYFNKKIDVTMGEVTRLISEHRYSHDEFPLS